MRRTIAACIVALLLGALAGRASAPSSPQPADPRSDPTRETVAAGVGFPRTPSGAALAAGAYQQLFADAAVLQPAELRRRIAEVATRSFAPVMVRANMPGARRLAQGVFGKGLRSGLSSVFLGVPLSYRLLSFSPSRAVVQTWGFTLLGNAGSFEPSAYFGLATTTLRWRQGEWKIADTRASFGPTPRLASPRRSGEGLGVLELTRELHRYGIAP